MKRIWSWKFLILLVLLGGTAAAVVPLYLKSRSSETTEFITATIDRGDVVYRINATGILRAVTTVQVGSQVTGRIRELYADFNSVVKKGQVLAQIDPTTFEAQVLRSRAELETSRAGVKNAEANLANRQAELVRAKAGLEGAQVTLRDTERGLKRAGELFEQNLIAERDLEAAQAGYDQAVARVNQAVAEISQAEMAIRSGQAQVEQAKANVRQAEAQLVISQANLKYTVITCPIDGIVIERNVDLGQTVAASLQAPTLFLIANDLKKMQVMANIDEADIGYINEDADVEFNVDAFPGETFRGKITEIRLNAVTTQNVVTYSVIIDVANPTLKLRPGMTANIRITVDEANDILRVPNAALRYHPRNKSEEELRALFEQLRQPQVAQLGAADGDSADKSATEDGSGEAFASRGSGRPQSGAAGLPAEGRRRRRAEGQEGAFNPARADRGQHFQERFGGAREGQAALPAAGAGNLPEPASDPGGPFQPGEKISFPKVPPYRPQPRFIWVLDGKEVRPVRVLAGLSDGTHTAVLRGELEEGQTIVIGETLDPDRPDSSGGVRSPFQPGFRPGSRPSRRPGS